MLCITENSIYILTGETSFLTNVQLLVLHGRRMTRSACGSSRHSAGAAGSRRQSFLKRRTLFLYASPTTVNGAFTPSRRRVVARATWAIVWWRCAWPDARRRAASMASASRGGAGAGDEHLEGGAAGRDEEEQREVIHCPRRRTSSRGRSSTAEGEAPRLVSTAEAQAHTGSQQATEAGFGLQAG